jgi:uncharacterized membrane protein
VRGPVAESPDRPRQPAHAQTANASPDEARARTTVPGSSLTTPRHRWFEAALVVKGIDGVLEVAGGFLLLFFPLGRLYELVTMATTRDLSNEPHDWIANSVRAAAEHLSSDTKLFASAYLLTHGAVKIFLVVALWRERLWAFPVALFFLTTFVVYQLYRYTHTHGISLLVFASIDVVVMWFVWDEYRARLNLMQEASPPSPDRSP